MTVEMDKRFELRNSLPPEVEEGNVEYKVKLVNPSATRMQHLITQMKWRLREGQGEAVYEIGVGDDGTMVGLTDNELTASLRTLKTMTSALSASMVTLSRRVVTKKSSEILRRSVVEVLVRKVPDNQQFIQLRIAVLGAVDAGKSTLCGVLTQGVLDDGRGKARLNLFRFLHEFQSGHTSSICIDFMGFDCRGSAVNYSDHTLEEIVENSTKLITLIDLAGDRKYLKTTIYGLTGHQPHYAAIVINASHGPTSITMEHLGLALTLSIPVFTIVTKSDAVSDFALKKLLATIETLFKKPGIDRHPKHIANAEDAVRCASLMTSENVVPVFTISNISGRGIDLLLRFLNVLPANGLSKSKFEEISLSAPLFSIDEVFHVPQVGLVVCGMLSDGILYERDRIQLGPSKNGKYHQGTIRSIHRNRRPVNSVKPGEAASIALEMEKLPQDEVRRGMVLINAKDIGISCRRFTARFYLLYHTSSEICIGFQATLYIGSICQRAKLIDLNASSVLPHRWTITTFEFCFPEYIRVGTPLIFRQGRSKGMGEVLEIL